MEGIQTEKTRKEKKKEDRHRRVYLDKAIAHVQRYLYKSGWLWGRYGYVRSLLVYCDGNGGWKEGEIREVCGRKWV